MRFRYVHTGSTHSHCVHLKCNLMMLKLFIPQANINKSNISCLFIYFIFLNKAPNHIQRLLEVLCSIKNRKQQISPGQGDSGREKLPSGKEPRADPNSGGLAICFGWFERIANTNNAEIETEGQSGNIYIDLQSFHFLKMYTYCR